MNIWQHIYNDRPLKYTEYFTYYCVTIVAQAHIIGVTLALSLTGWWWWWWWWWWWYNMMTIMIDDDADGSDYNDGVTS